MGDDQGLPLHLWCASRATVLCHIGDLCGGFIHGDDDGGGSFEFLRFQVRAQGVVPSLIPIIVGEECLRFRFWKIKLG